MDYNALLKLAITAAIKGGEEILRVYTTNFYIETKADNTPVTAADKASSKSIIRVLEEAQLPIISEEEPVSNYNERKTWEYVWLVDPLDGTKEFVKRNGEFAVNVALVKNKIPVIGVIYAPVSGDIYFAMNDFGSFKGNKNNLPPLSEAGWFTSLLETGKKLPLQTVPKNYTLVASRSHLSREVNTRIEKLKNLYGVVDIINVGSSIKQCWVAEGRAHEYPRYGTTMEWDTAAGQCILEQSGNKLIDLETGLPMRYNKEYMQNSFFIATH